MTGPLRALWRTPPATPAPPRRVWRDWLLLAVFVPLPLVEALLRPELPWVLLWAISTAAVAPSLLFRRTSPLAAFSAAYVVIGAVTIVTGGGTELYSSAYLALLPYCCVRWGSGRSAVVGLAMVTTSLALSVWPGRAPIADIIGSVAVTIAIVALALALRYRATARLRERDRIVLLERESLARDLHDTVAHHVSAIAIRAQAGLATASNDPQAAAEALRIIEAEASRTLGEMRTIVRALRTVGDADLTPPPTLADLARLEEDPGCPVEVTVRGDVDHLDPALAAAVFRIAREAVTNARRHARGASLIRVEVEGSSTQVRVAVRDDGSETKATAPGLGLTGMVERASLLGGTCTAGPQAGGGWAVIADLPTSSRAA